MFTLHEFDNTVITELSDDSFIISETQDGVDLLGNAGLYSGNKIIVHEKNLHPDFFKLHTGLAGDILQKFSNYGYKLAIVGDFSQYESKNLHDFIRESNRGNQIFFVPTLDEALCILARR